MPSAMRRIRHEWIKIHRLVVSVHYPTGKRVPYVRQSQEDFGYLSKNCSVSRYDLPLIPSCQRQVNLKGGEKSMLF